jgi:hypothetical protein
MSGGETLATCAAATGKKSISPSVQTAAAKASAGIALTNPVKANPVPKIRKPATIARRAE